MNVVTRKTAVYFCVVAALAVCWGNARAADPVAEVAAIHAADQAWLKGYNSGDVGAVVSLYGEDAVLLPPGAPRANGRTAIRAFFDKDMAASAKEGLKFSLGAYPDGGVSGDMGWSSGTYAVKDKSGHVVDTGKYLSVSRKKGGKWLYIRDTWNSDGPPASAESAAAPKK
jgi:ketosteroid isomerase-like protein